MIECFQCHEMVSMHEFRQHQEVWKKEEGKQTLQTLQCVKKKSISLWLVDFAIRHVDFVLYLPNGEVKFVLDFLKIF